jgi:hypothetical protein
MPVAQPAPEPFQPRLPVPVALAALHPVERPSVVAGRLPLAGVDPSCDAGPCSDGVEARAAAFRYGCGWLVERCGDERTVSRWANPVLIRRRCGGQGQGQDYGCYRKQSSDVEPPPRWSGSGTTASAQRPWRALGAVSSSDGAPHTALEVAVPLAAAGHEDGR